MSGIVIDLRQGPSAIEAEQRNANALERGAEGRGAHCIAKSTRCTIRLMLSCRGYADIILHVRKQAMQKPMFCMKTKMYA